jgi:DICT domain-containing protein
MTTTFSIGDVADRTGVPEGTLRMWERRHRFPVPQRLPSGHRRYSERDVELVRRVAAERAAGVALGTAIERASRDPEPPATSLYAALRRHRPDIEPRLLPKRLMIALSHAIEDESLARAERPILFAAFQRERFYRQAQARWRALSLHAELTVAFADFEVPRSPRGGPAEIPLRRDSPLAREWAIVCDAPGHAVCLLGREALASGRDDGHGRSFETVWSVEPDVVRDAALACAQITAASHPALAGRFRARLEAAPARPAGDQLRLAAAITNRTLSYLA